MSARNACPVCGETRAVSKVSAIYLAGIQARNPKAIGGEPLVKVSGIPEDAMPGFSRKFTPPATKKEVQVRLVHPDMVVLVFSAIVPFFLRGIYLQQPTLFNPVLAGLVILYGVYVWQRKIILKRFERQVQAEKAKNERVQRGIQRWINLYYCAEDDVIFEPGGASPLPSDQINGYLFQD
jgi:hypothetical protein